VAAAFPLLVAYAASAQPTLTVSTNASANMSSNVVIPGKPVTLKVSEPGGAGKQYALIASAYGSGFSYAGTHLAVGPDVVVLAIGTLSGTASATLEYTPPFLGTTLDRFYVQAVTAFTSAFSPLLASNGVVLRNGDLVSGHIGSNINRLSFSILIGDNYIMATPSFVAARDQTCLVTSSLQFNPIAVIGNGTFAGQFRIAVSRNGSPEEDDVTGQFLMGTGTSLTISPITLASAIAIRAGETIQFGGYFDSNFTGSANVQTGYICQ
jgi:hypothetical protein